MNKGDKKRRKILTEEHKNAISSGMKKAIINGWKPNTKNLISGFSSLNADRKIIEKRSARAGQTMRGRPQPMGPTGKNTDHCCAKEWSFHCKSNGYVLKGKNLNQLVRDNAFMFSEEDLNWDGCGCNATRALGALCRRKGGTGCFSWKGWMVNYQ